MRKILAGFVLVLLCSCTAVDYRSSDFVPKTQSHQTIAVLPFEMVFQGKAPANWTAQQIWQIEQEESLAFQSALHDFLLRRSGPDRRARIYIDIQPVQTTNGILADHDIGIVESWSLPAEELAEILEVDAVVRTSVWKTRYLSDLASLGIDLGAYILHELTNDAHVWSLFAGSKTYDIYADSVLLNGNDGRLLWRVALHRETDWTRPANDVVVGITKKLARKFPYQG